VSLLAILNFFIYRSISRATASHNNISSAHRRDSTMARLLMAIVIVFLCCHSTKIIVNFYEALQVDSVLAATEHPDRACSHQMVRHGELTEHPDWVMLLVKINHLLLTINSATNIIIYSYKVTKLGGHQTKTPRQDFKFRTVIVSAFQRKRSFTSFRTSVRSSFGSSRYNCRSQVTLRALHCTVTLRALHCTAGVAAPGD
jgi:hypothetical protein